MRKKVKKLRRKTSASGSRRKKKTRYVSPTCEPRESLYHVIRCGE